MSSSKTAPVIYVHPNQSEWGRGVVLGTRENKVVMQFESGGTRIFQESFLASLQPVELPDAEARAVDASLRGKKGASVARASGASGAKKARAVPKAKAVFESFEAQLALFETKFPGGFSGDAYLDGDRGRPGVEGTRGYKEWGIVLAQTTLSPQRFAEGSPEELFADINKVITQTNLVHAFEGRIAFGRIPEETRPVVVDAVRDLLHGEGEYADRLERLAERIPLDDGKGKVKPLSWPLATVLGALYAPTVHTAVKPTPFSAQASLVGLAPFKPEQVDAAGYAKFLEVALATQEKLAAAGHAPRDLLDVHTFIWRTHAEKPKPA